MRPRLILFGALGVVEAGGSSATPPAPAGSTGRCTSCAGRCRRSPSGLEAARPTSSAPSACLEQARRALRELDATVNGRRPGAIGSPGPDHRGARGPRAALALRRRRGRGACPRRRDRCRPDDGSAPRSTTWSPTRSVTAAGSSRSERRPAAATRASRSATAVRRPAGPAPKAARGGPVTATGSTWSPESPRPTEGSATPAGPAHGGGTLAAISLPVAGAEPSVG